MQLINFSILDAIINPVLVIDIDYNIIFANKAACNLYKISSEEIVNRKCYEVSHNNINPCWNYENNDCPIKLAVKKQAPQKIIHKHIIDNKTFYEEISCVPFLDDNKKILFVVEELNDVTETIYNKKILNDLKVELNKLKSLIPICSYCKKIRNDEGYWEQLESYIKKESGSDFTHGICPECKEKLLKEIKK